MRVLEDALQTWISAAISEDVYVIKVDDAEAVFDNQETFVVFAVSEEDEQTYLNSASEYAADVDLRVYSPDKYYPRDLIDRIAERVALESITGITLLDVPEISKGNGEPAGTGWIFYPLGIKLIYKEP